MVSSLATLVNCCPLRASVAAFLCLIVDHLECPDIRPESLLHPERHGLAFPPPQDHPGARLDLVLRRGDQPVIHRQAALPGQAPHLTLTGEQAGPETERVAPLQSRGTPPPR